MSIKVALAQITTDPGQITANTAKIIEHIKSARAAGAKLIVFPELAVPGYAAMDLLFNKSYLAANRAAINEIVAAADNIAVLVGFADFEPGKSRAGSRPLLYNSVAVIQNAKLLGIQDKTHIPNYNIFFEDRYFSRGRGGKVYDLGFARVGVEICEDLWGSDYLQDVSVELVSQGAELIVNLSASPFNLGKIGEREQLIFSTVNKLRVPLLYCNLVGSFDGFDGELVFDGRSSAIDANGQVIAAGAAFAEDLLLFELGGAPISLQPPLSQGHELYEALVLGVREYFRRVGDLGGAGFKRAIVGISGGIDSAVVAAIAAAAIGPQAVMGVTLPSAISSKETLADSHQVAKNLGIQIYESAIESQYTATLEVLKKIPEIACLPEDVAEENVQARLRMINLMYFANKFAGIVLNTGNKTELALDNCTIYGDMVGGFSVLGDVDKDRVYDLARYINSKAGAEVIPSSIIDRVPTAELRHGQIDATVMGADPQLIAPLVRAIVEGNLSFKDCCERYAGETADGKFPESLILRTFKRLDRSEWKRRQAAPAIRVTPLAFGIGRRMPMSHGYVA